MQEREDALPMPYVSPTVRREFGRRYAQSSEISLRKRIRTKYLEPTSLKGVSSMKLHRDLRIRPAAAWSMSQSIRESLIPSLSSGFAGQLVVGETYVGAKKTNKPAQKKLTAGSGAVGKAILEGTMDQSVHGRARSLQGIQ